METDRHADVVQVQHLGALVEEHPLGQAGGTPGVHEHDRIVLVRFIGHHGASCCQQVLIAHVVGRLAVAYEHHAAQWELIADLGDVAGEVVGEQRVDERHLGARVGEDELQLLPCQPQVQGVDDAGAQERGVVQLEELVAVGRHHCDAVAAAHAELGPHRIRQAEHAVAVLGEGGVVVAVVEADLRGQAVHGRKEAPVKYEFLHSCTSLHLPYCSICASGAAHERRRSHVRRRPPPHIRDQCPGQA